MIALKEAKHFSEDVELPKCEAIPVAGQVAIFNHKLLHSARMIQAGIKYTLIRSDMHNIFLFRVVYRHYSNSDT